MISQKAGEYRIIRINGDEKTIKEKPSLSLIYKEIGCETIDTVTLNRETMTIMLIDDNGMIDHKPINSKATELARQVFGPQYLHHIHGDVAIVNDQDFE